MRWHPGPYSWIWGRATRVSEGGRTRREAERERGGKGGKGGMVVDLTKFGRKSTPLYVILLLLL